MLPSLKRTLSESSNGGWGSEEEDWGEQEANAEGWDDMKESDDLDEVAMEDKDALNFLTSDLYQVLELEAVKELQIESSERVSNQLDITSSAAGALLKHCRWDEKVLLAQYAENATELCAAAHISCSLHSVMLPVSATAGARELCCPVCFDDVLETSTFSLNCAHKFCVDCWVSYLNCEIDSGAISGGNCLTSTCPEFKCKEIVGEEAFEMLLSTTQFEKYQGMKLRSFVTDREDFTWCPHTGCSKVIGFAKTKKAVTCTCSHRFCFTCKETAHHPASCQVAEKWRTRDQGSENLSAKFMLDNTKPCPYCGVRTKKEDGCMAVMCTQCRKEWCWHCGGGDHHVWQCNKPAYNTNKDHDKDDRAKYLFYFERYFNHTESLKIAKDVRQKTMEKMDLLVLDGAHIKSVQYLISATNIIIECRRVLAWTYVHAFAIEEKGALELFEYRQSELEEFTERLNKLTESEDQELAEKKKVQDLTRALTGYLAHIECGES